MPSQSGRKRPGARPDAEQWWFNTATGQAEFGRRSSWEHRMGPYPTRAEAEAALETARRRNEQWEAQDGD